MRYLFFTVSLLCTIFILPSCKKEKSPLTGVVKELQGSWELRSREGGFGGVTDHAPGNGEKFVFTGNIHQHVVDGKVVAQQFFTIVTRPSYSSQQVNDYIETPLKPRGLSTIVRIEGDKLHFILEADDGGSSTWQRE